MYVQEAEHHLQHAVSLASVGNCDATDADLACHQHHLACALWARLSPLANPWEHAATPGEQAGDSRGATEDSQQHPTQHAENGFRVEGSQSHGKLQEGPGELADRAHSLWVASAAVQSPCQADACAWLGVYSRDTAADARKFFQKALAIDARHRIAGGGSGVLCSGACGPSCVALCMVLLIMLPRAGAS